MLKLLTRVHLFLENPENQHLRGSSEDQQIQRRAEELEEQLAAVAVAAQGPPANGGQYRPDLVDLAWDEDEEDQPLPPRPPTPAPPPPPQLPTVAEEEEPLPVEDPGQEPERPMEEENQPPVIQQQRETVVVVVGPEDPQMTADQTADLMEVTNFVLPPPLPPARDDVDRRPFMRIRVPGRRITSVNPPVRPLPPNTLQYFEALRESSQLKLLLREIFSHSTIAVDILEECALTSNRYILGNLARLIDG
jgi:hypothetical protein